MRIAPLHEEGALTPRCPWGGNRGVTEGTPRSPPIAGLFSVFSVPSVRTLFFALRTNETGVSRRREKKKRLRRDARGGYRGVSGFYDPAIPTLCHFFLCVLCALCANPVFQCRYKSVSRRREKKGRLRRDACSLCALCANPVFQCRYKSVSRRREEKGRLRRDKLCSLCETLFCSLKHAELKSGVLSLALTGCGVLFSLLRGTSTRPSRRVTCGETYRWVEPFVESSRF